jgi:membrane-associated phospholipid phosphatase
VWLVAFQTAAGARLDATVLAGFTGLSGSRVGPLGSAAAELAGPIPFAALSLVLVAIALARRRPRHALVVVVVLAGANVTTQLLKQLVTAPRPAEAPPGVPLETAWPSGHTTAAMALALCLVLVVPARWRPLAAAAGGIYAVGEGYGVLVAGWHYPSDVVGAFGIATAWLALSVAALRIGTGRVADRRPRGPSVLAPAAVAALSGAALAAGIMLMRPARTLEYAQAHEAFVPAAVALGAAGLALAAATAAALQSIEHGASVNDRRELP